MKSPSPLGNLYQWSGGDPTSVGGVDTNPLMGDGLVVLPWESSPLPAYVIPDPFKFEENWIHACEND